MPRESTYRVIIPARGDVLATADLAAAIAASYAHGGRSCYVYVGDGPRPCRWDSLDPLAVGACCNLRDPEHVELHKLRSEET